MIYTSSYRAINLKDYKDQVISISGDRGKLVDYKGECYPTLAPKKGFWQEWHNNIGKVSAKENAKFYIREYYKQVLSKLDVNKEYKNLDNKILLCYEDPRAFCHRQIVASWFELYLKEDVPEVEEDKDKKLVVKTSRTFIKNYLEEVIKENVDMKGFDSLYALNLYNKGEELEKRALNNNDLELAKYLKDLAIEETYDNKNKLRK
jgi:hypothetical protein